MTNLEIQIAINNSGYGPVMEDGAVGPQSVAALRRFQQAKGLVVDGIVGPKTEAALRAVPAPVAMPLGTGFPMTFSDKGLKMLSVSEAVKTKAYYDSAKPPVLTIGIGCTWGSKRFREWWAANKPGETFTIKSTLTVAQAYEAARLVIDEEYGAAVNKAIKHTVPQTAFDAAVHFCFNAGTGSTTWRWIVPFREGRYCEAADIIETYLKPPELKSRRQRESNLMCHGVYYGG